MHFHSLYKCHFLFSRVQISDQFNPLQINPPKGSKPLGWALGTHNCPNFTDLTDQCRLCFPCPHLACSYFRTCCVFTGVSIKGKYSPEEGFYISPSSQLAGKDSHLKNQNSGQGTCQADTGYMVLAYEFIQRRTGYTEGTQMSRKHCRSLAFRARVSNSRRDAASLEGQEVPHSPAIHFVLRSTQGSREVAWQKEKESNVRRCQTQGLALPPSTIVHLQHLYSSILDSS